MDSFNTIRNFSRLPQEHQYLISICNPKLVSESYPLEEETRKLYGSLADELITDINMLDFWLHVDLIDKGNIQRDIPHGVLEYYKNTIIPDLPAIQDALVILNPERAKVHKEFTRIINSQYEGDNIKRAFMVGIDDVMEIIEDEESAKTLDPHGASRIIKSDLINFDPDQWLRNTQDLGPIITSRNDSDIPVQAKFRLIEIFRSYIFGNWLSVLVLSRSVLEYAILDNLHKYKISETYITSSPKRQKRTKNLSQLIKEIGALLPEILPSMEKIRAYGNEYVHPRKKNKEALFQRSKNARICLLLLKDVVETLYHPRSNDSTD